MAERDNRPYRIYSKIPAFSTELAASCYLLVAKINEMIVGGISKCLRPIMQGNPQQFSLFVVRGCRSNVSF
jgi:hypothetical protein